MPFYETDLFNVGWVVIKNYILGYARLIHIAPRIWLSGQLFLDWLRLQWMQNCFSFPLLYANKKGRFKKFYQKLNIMLLFPTYS